MLEAVTADPAHWSGRWSSFIAVLPLAVHTLPSANVAARQQQGWRVRKSANCKHVSLTSGFLQSANDCPPTSASYGTTPIWCRGGNRYVEGCWGFRYLKIEKFVGFTKCPFHVFDRYEMHIQDFEDFGYGNLHHFPVSVFDFSKFVNSKFSKY